MTEKELSKFNEKTVKKVNEMTYMSDLFMSYALKDPEVLKHFIRTCIGDHSIELNSTATQQRFNNIKGKEIVFDSVSEDSKGNVYNVEIENRPGRGSLERNIFHVSALCTQSVSKGLKDYRYMPTAHSIMLVKGDALHNGKQKNVFEMRNTYSPFMALTASKLICIIINILESGDDEALNQLCKDVQQTDYRNIQNEALARRMNEIKEGKEFIEMCEVLESYGNERYEDGIIVGKVEEAENSARKAMLKFLEMNWSLTMISEFLERDIEEIESWAKESGIPYHIN